MRACPLYVYRCMRFHTEPRDVVWRNASAPAGQVALRGIVANVLLVIGAVLWSIPVASLQVSTAWVGWAR